MEDFLSGEMAIGIASAIAGALAMGIILGARGLAKSFKESSNKIDDQFVPLLERIANALENKE